MEDFLTYLNEKRAKIQSELSESGRLYIRQLQKRFIMEDLKRKRIELISKIYDKKGDIVVCYDNKTYESNLTLN
jgi:hypothetical protein